MKLKDIKRLADKELMQDVLSLAGRAYKECLRTNSCTTVIVMKSNAKEFEEWCDSASIPCYITTDIPREEYTCFCIAPSYASLEKYIATRLQGREKRSNWR